MLGPVAHGCCTLLLGMTHVSTTSRAHEPQAVKRLDSVLPGSPDLVISTRACRGQAHALTIIVIA
jgi:hypothetical protein